MTGAAGHLAPRKLDSMDKRDYKEMGSTQAAAAKDKVQAVNEKAKARNTNSARQKPGAAAAQDEGLANWRTGNFGGPSPRQMPQHTPTIIDGEERKAAAQLQVPQGQGKGGRRKNSARGGNRGRGDPDAPEGEQPQRPATQCYGADTIIRDEEEKKVSKHAKRRANKKAK